MSLTTFRRDEPRSRLPCGSRPSGRTAWPSRQPRIGQGQAPGAHVAGDGAALRRSWTGQAGNGAIEATARVVEGQELEEIRRQVKAKYGFQTKITKALSTLWGILRGKRIPYGDRGVIVTPVQGGPAGPPTARSGRESVVCLSAYRARRVRSRGVRWGPRPKVAAPATGSGAVW